MYCVCQAVQKREGQERRRPVREQERAVRCDVCERWFRSRGSLAVHRCVREEGAGGQDSSHTTIIACAGAGVQSGQDGKPDRNTAVSVTGGSTGL